MHRNGEGQGEMGGEKTSPATGAFREDMGCWTQGMAGHADEFSTLDMKDATTKGIGIKPVKYF